MSGATISHAPWLADEALQTLLSMLDGNGEEARIAGGAVRNTLMDEAVTDIDIATTALPDETTRRAEAAGFKVVPTGIDHGTVTVVTGSGAFEVTSLRADIETDGRHAKVAFGRDWKADAERRDFTINALYATSTGEVIDLVGGLDDLRERRLRFIGDAEARIREDYLRILRFFRFFAWYGKGRPDSEGLKACARLKGGLSHLSAERVWSELRKLLSAPDPSRSLLWMRQASVLSTVLPESEKWGIDTIHALAAAERDLGWDADALLRLEAIIPPDVARISAMAERLRLSKAETARLTGWAGFGAVLPDISDKAFRKRLYGAAEHGARDVLRLQLASARAQAMTDHAALIRAGRYSALLRQAQDWVRPVFPLRGSDLLQLGLTAGPEVGARLSDLENRWIESDFALDRDALTDIARDGIKKGV